MKYLRYFESVDEFYSIGDIVKLARTIPYDKYNVGDLFRITALNRGDVNFPYESIKIGSTEFVWLSRSEVEDATEEEITAIKYNL